MAFNESLDTLDTAMRWVETARTLPDERDALDSIFYESCQWLNTEDKETLRQFVEEIKRADVPGKE